MRPGLLIRLIIGIGKYFLNLPKKLTALPTIAQKEEFCLEITYSLFPYQSFYLGLVVKERRSNGKSIADKPSSSRRRQPQTHTLRHSPFGIHGRQRGTPSQSV